MQGLKERYYIYSESRRLYQEHPEPPAPPSPPQKNKKWKKKEKYQENPGPKNEYEKKAILWEIKNQKESMKKANMWEILNNKIFIIKEICGKFRAKKRLWKKYVKFEPKTEYEKNKYE